MDSCSSEALISQLPFCLLASVANSLLSKGAAPQTFSMCSEGAADSYSPCAELKAPSTKNSLQMWLSLSPGKSKAVWSYLEEIHSTLQSIVKSDLMFHNDPLLVSSQNSNCEHTSEIIPSLYLWLTKGLEEKGCQYPIHNTDIILGAPFHECRAFKTAAI